MIGFFGAATFITYGVLSDAWPVVATNSATLTLHVVHLRRASRDATWQRKFKGRASDDRFPQADRAVVAGSDLRGDS